MAAGGRFDMKCSTPTNTKILAIRLKKFGSSRISMQLAADYSTSPPEREFITKASTSQKKFGQFSPGSTCLMHSSHNTENVYPIFLVVMTHAAGTTANCQVTKIITNKGLEACSGPSRDLWTLIKPEFGDGNIGNFGRFKIESENDYTNFAGRVYTLKDSGVSGLDERLVEMMLLGALEDPDSVNNRVFNVDYKIIREINKNYALNSAFATKIDPSKLVPRIVKDDLPGYFLGVYTPGGSDETEKSAQMYFLGVQRDLKSLHTEFYLEKPSAILAAETHSVVITYKNWAQKASHELKLKEFQYKISISRISGNLKFVVYEVVGASETQSLTLNYPDNGSNTGYLYFSFTIGRGILYYIDAQNVRSKAHETLHVFRVGESRARAHRSYEETLLLSALYQTASTESKTRYCKIELKPDAPVTTNKVGVRVVGVSTSRAVYPAFLVSSVTNLADFPRCYFDGYKKGQCFSLAFLAGPSEADMPTVRSNKDAKKISAGSELRVNCRVALSATNCLIPKSGFMTNLEVNRKVAVYKRLLSEVEFDAHSVEQRKMVVEFQSNLGTRYFVSCDYSCEACGQDLKCSSCPDGSQPKPSDGTCDTSACTNAYKCSKCAGPQQCRWCTNKAIHPTANGEYTCQDSCDPGYQFRDPSYKYECLRCPNLKCATCDPLDACATCADPNHRLLAQIHSDRLPAGTAFHGSKDCFSPAEITDYFYNDGTDFIPCMSKCKRCTGANDCTECKDYQSPGATVYLINNVSPHVCSDTCLKSDDRYLLPAGEAAGCLQCTGSTYYIEGVSPAACGSCAGAGFYFDSTNKICKRCGSGCDQCDSSLSCSACSDSEHFVQVDGKTCGAGCSAREMTATATAGTPKRCQTCPQGCETCDETTGCAQCQSNYHPNPTPEVGCLECPAGCSTCNSQTECLSCSDPAQFLQTDRVTCSQNCPERHYQDSASNTKRCVECPQNCLECDQRGCLRCQNSFFNKQGVCSACPENCLECDSKGCLECRSPLNVSKGGCVACSDSCQECGSGGCQKCKPGFRLAQNSCQSCPKDCLECNETGCTKCKPNLVYYQVECRKGKLVKYVIRQSPSSSSDPATFNLRLNLEEQAEIRQKTYSEIEKSILANDRKLAIEAPEIASELSFGITKSKSSNEFIILVNFAEEKNFKSGQKISLTIKTFSASLDPEFTDPLNLYTLEQKTQKMVVEYFDGPKEALLATTRRIASVTSSANTVSSSATLGLGVVLGLLSKDPNGIFLKFNQFLSLLERIKLIGMWFGRSLKAFIEGISLDQNNQNFTKNGKNSENSKIAKIGKFGASGGLVRVLELSVKENQKGMIGQESNGYHYKLDDFGESIFFEGVFMLQSVAFLVSWGLKLLGMAFLGRMRSKGEVVKWQLKYLKYQRKVHFSVVMSVVMDLFFYGGRIILHRRLNRSSFVPKLFCALNITLVIIDLLEMLWVTTSLKYEGKSQKIEKIEKIENLKKSKIPNDDQKSIKNPKEGRNTPLQKEKTIAQKSPPYPPPTEKQQQQIPQKETKFPSSSLQTPKNPSINITRTKTQKNPRTQKKKKSRLGTFLRRLKHLNPAPPKRSSLISRVNRGHHHPRPPNPLQRSRPLPKGARPQRNAISLAQATNPAQPTPKKPKTAINHKKTIWYNSRNLEVESFGRSMLRDNPSIYDTPILLPNNLFNVYHLCLLQLAILALPHSPALCLSLLLLSELFFMLFLTVLPYWRHVKFISSLDFWGKFVRFVCMAGFFLVCLLIRIERAGLEGASRPVGQKLQNFGILCISAGVLATYLFAAVKVVLLVRGLVRDWLEGRRRRREGPVGEDLTKEQRGLVFYQEKEIGYVKSLDGVSGGGFGGFGPDFGGFWRNSKNGGRAKNLVRRGVRGARGTSIASNLGRSGRITSKNRQNMKKSGFILSGRKSKKSSFQRSRITNKAKKEQESTTGGSKSSLKSQKHQLNEKSQLYQKLPKNGLNDNKREEEGPEDASECIPLALRPKLTPKRPKNRPPNFGPKRLENGDEWSELYI